MIILEPPKRRNRAQDCRGQIITIRSNSGFGPTKKIIKLCRFYIWYFVKLLNSFPMFWGLLSYLASYLK
jgi:hypothetical protein